MPLSRTQMGNRTKKREKKGRHQCTVCKKTFARKWNLTIKQPVFQTTCENNQNNVSRRNRQCCFTEAMVDNVDNSLFLNAL